VWGDGLEHWAGLFAAALFILTAAWIIVLLLWHRDPQKSLVAWFMELWFDPWHKKRKGRDTDRE
jgi:hypothetical protein